jgi:LacI family transcriptional regulator
VVSQTVIARKLNLSQRTVSLCLAGSDRVAEQTRKKVLKVAAELGYRPNRSALSMRSGRFNAIALLQSTSQQYSYLPGGLLAGVQEVLAQRRLHLVLASLPEAKLNDDDVLPIVLSEWLVDGFLVNYNYGFSQRFVQAIEQNRLPSIWLNTKRPYGCVYPDDVGAGRALTERLVALGHRRIDYVCHRAWDEHFSVADRYAGYESVMTAAGLAPRKHVLDGRTVPWGDADAGVKFMRQILERPDRPTAIVAYEGFESIRLVIAAASLGLSIPRDLSICSFHERDMTTAGFPITVLEIPEHEMGQRALDMLLARIEDNDARVPPVAMPYSRLSGATIAAPIKR